ncbi:hypothetical protein V6N13_117167 [Hibiscus sabdariffa]
MKRSDLLMILTATALLRPCFLKNNVKTALASSFSAAIRVGDTTLELKDPSNSESAAVIQKLALVPNGGREVEKHVASPRVPLDAL